MSLRDDVDRLNRLPPHSSGGTSHRSPVPHRPTSQGGADVSDRNDLEEVQGSGESEDSGESGEAHRSDPEG